MEIITKTDIGNTRLINQDNVSFYRKNDEEFLVVLCDGMGGHNAGEVASQIACDTIIDFYKIHEDFSGGEGIEEWMKQIIMDAHLLIKEKSLADESMKGMGTTVVLVMIVNNQVHIAHVGDSRAYLYENRELKQLTKDDTLVNALLEAGSISKEDAESHPQKNILIQAVGVSDNLQVTYTTFDFTKGSLLLCSDGLYNSLNANQLSGILEKNCDLETKANTLVDAAKTYGGQDNIGLAIIESEGEITNESDK